MTKLVLLNSTIDWLNHRKEYLNREILSLQLQLITINKDLKKYETKKKQEEKKEVL